MSQVIRDGKFVELTYKVNDRKTGHVLTRVEFPLGYVHGHNEILAPSVHSQLEGRSAGDTIQVTIDGNQIGVYVTDASVELTNNLITFQTSSGVRRDGGAGENCRRRGRSGRSGRRCSRR